MALPLQIIIDTDIDSIFEWVENHFKQLHDASLTAASELIVNADIQSLPVICFYRDQRASKPFAEITMFRKDAIEALQKAEEFYVSEELYEQAAKAKNYQKLLYTKTI